MTLVEKYRALVADGVIEADPAQAAVVARLDELARAAAALAAAAQRVLPHCCARRAGAQRALHFRPRRPRQDHADGPVLRDHHVPAEAPHAFPRVHGRGARPHRRRAQGHARAIPFRRSRAAIAAKARAAVLRRDARHRHRRRHDPRAACSRRCSSIRWWWWRPPTCRRASSTRTASTARCSCRSSSCIAAAHGRGGAAGGQGLPAREARRQAALFHAGRRQGQGRDGPAVGRADRQPSGRAGGAGRQGPQAACAAGVDGRGALHVRRAVRAAARHARLSAHRARTSTPC